jgi:hypothetical protein
MKSTYEFIQSLTGFEIGFWDFGEMGFEIRLKVRSGSFDF